MNLFKSLILTCLICFASTAALAQGVKKAMKAQRPVDGDKLLSLGDFYNDSNDITDAADSYYRKAVNNATPGSLTAGYAQYSRGSYWFRKYYIVKEQFSKADSSALAAAEVNYYNFIDQFARQTNTIELLSDAEFYLALVYLQQGKRDYAIGWLNRMTYEAVPLDKSVYVYQVVWSSNAADTVDRTVNALELAKFARQSIQKGRDFNSVVSEIKRWCQRQ